MVIAYLLIGRRQLKGIEIRRVFMAFGDTHGNWFVGNVTSHPGVGFKLNMSVLSFPFIGLTDGLEGTMRMLHIFLLYSKITQLGG